MPMDFKLKKKKVIERPLDSEPMVEQDNPYEKDSDVYSQRSEKEKEDLDLKSKKFKNLLKLISK